MFKVKNLLQVKKQSFVTESAKKIVQSILHGDSTVPQQQQLPKTTHSKLLAKGKYVHELSIHNVKPEAMTDYLSLVKDNYPRIADDPSFKVKLFGSWTTEIGDDLDQVVHIWQYHHYPGYTETIQRLSNDSKYQSFQKELRPMLRSRQNQIVLEFSFWEAVQQVSDPNGIYELRSYLLKPGQLLEWENEWRRGIEARKKFVQPVGAWFSQLGELNYVHHMWKYPDLQTRKEMREKAWEMDVWANTVSKTVKLIDHMQCRILKPTTFSPSK